MGSISRPFGPLFLMTSGPFELPFDEREDSSHTSSDAFVIYKTSISEPLQTALLYERLHTLTRSLQQRKYIHKLLLMVFNVFSKFLYYKIRSLYILNWIKIKTHSGYKFWILFIFTLIKISRLAEFHSFPNKIKFLTKTRGKIMGTKRGIRSYST